MCLRRGMVRGMYLVRKRSVWCVRGGDGADGSTYIRSAHVAWGVPTAKDKVKYVWNNQAVPYIQNTCIPEYNMYNGNHQTTEAKENKRE